MKYLKLKLDRANYFVTLVLIVIYIFLTLKTIHALPEEAITENINGELLDSDKSDKSKVYICIFWGFVIIIMLVHFYNKSDPGIGILDQELNLNKVIPTQDLNKVIPTQDLNLDKVIPTQANIERVWPSEVTIEHRQDFNIGIEGPKQVNHGIERIDD
jgi:hypothetical protein